jgi:hypothetical protein
LGNRRASTDAAEDHPPPSRKQIGMKSMMEMSGGFQVGVDFFFFLRLQQCLTVELLGDGLTLVMYDVSR